LVSDEGEETVPTLDPRAPLVLDTHTLARRPGELRTIALTVSAPSDLGNDVIAVPDGADLTLDLRLESVVEGILVSGTVAATALGECVRCLDPVHLRVRLPIQELYAYPEMSAADDEEIRTIEDDLIDLEPVVRDGVVLTLPLQPLCRDDCPGLCPACGTRLADDPTHHHEQLDPRWSALQGLTDPTE
jgi:uncharacterized protein